MSSAPDLQPANPAGFWLETTRDVHIALEPVMTVMERGFDPAFGEAWNRAQTRSMLMMPLAHTVLARSLVDDSALGFAMTRRVADEEELLLIAVLPAWRRRGIGYALINLVIDNATNAGVRQVFLEVRDNNLALDFYLHFGFIVTGIRKNYYIGKNGKNFDALTLSMSL